MAKITVTFDTITKEVSGSMDGQELSFDDLSIYKGYDYDNEKERFELRMSKYERDKSTGITTQTMTYASEQNYVEHEIVRRALGKRPR